MTLMDPTRTWVPAAEAASYYAFKTVRCFERWLTAPDQREVRWSRFNRRLFVRRADLDAAFVPGNPQWRKRA